MEGTKERATLLGQPKGVLVKAHLTWLLTSRCSQVPPGVREEWHLQGLIRDCMVMDGDSQLRLWGTDIDYGLWLASIV